MMKAVGPVGVRLTRRDMDSSPQRMHSMTIRGLSFPMRRFGAACALLVLTACASVASDPGATVVIVGATVIHPQKDGVAAVARDQTIVLAGPRIASVGPAGAI